jgi:hypothetical protein
MRGKVLARIPQDNGKVIHWGGGIKETVEPQQCEFCDKPAELVVQGETDSFGFETIHLCSACNNADKEESEAHEQALDIEDKKGRFVVSATTNIDSKYDWNMNFQSRRAAVAFLRHIEKVAEPYGGLYPREGALQEMSCSPDEQPDGFGAQEPRFKVSDNDSYVAHIDVDRL